MITTKCNNDGHILEETENPNIIICDFCFSIYCAECGTEIPPLLDYVSCKKCGKKFNEVFVNILYIHHEKGDLKIFSNCFTENQFIPLNGFRSFFKNIGFTDINWARIRFNVAQSFWEIRITKKIRDTTPFTIKLGKLSSTKNDILSPSVVYDENSKYLWIPLEKPAEIKIFGSKFIFEPSKEKD